QGLFYMVGNQYAATLTHDFIADLSYPLGGNGNVGLSYDQTVLSDTQRTNSVLFINPPFVPALGFSECPPSITRNGVGDYQRFTTIRGSVNLFLAKNLYSQA